MKEVFSIIQIILAVLIVTFILLQSQGSGLGGTFGGGGGENYHTRRGIEKVVFYLTIAAIVLFMVIAISLLLI